jgi:hypothetical protein
MNEVDSGIRFRQIHGVSPWASEDPSPERVWWSDAGVHQNITFPVHPDPVSGMHCWHQKVRVRPALPDDRYADVFVDFEKARAVYRKWLGLARPATGPLRRPMWLFRPVKPAASAYRLDAPGAALSRCEVEAGRFYELVDWDPTEVWGRCDD